MDCINQILNGNGLLLASAFMISCATGAQSEPCTPSGDYCTPFVGCIEESGEIFRGQTRGRKDGPLLAGSSKGAICKGTWLRTQSGMGVASFECNDGRRGMTIYSYFEETSGTAVGDVEFNNGQQGQFWAGWNLEAYFDQVAPEDRQRMACEPHDMLVG